ncbi:MAG: AMP-binding protein [Acidimicrobiales bacterium]
MIDLEALLAAAPDRYEIGPTDVEDPALLHFTSGTTGRPKGAIHVHEAVVAHASTGAWSFDLSRARRSGAPPTLVGSPAPRTGSSPRSSTV